MFFPLTVSVSNWFNNVFGRTHGEQVVGDDPIPTLTAKAASPERGILIAGLAALNVNFLPFSYPRASFQGAIAYRLSAVGADLKGANLSGADLRAASFGDANLEYANLSVADLSGADLSRANLSVADLRGADLRRARLVGTSLSNANLSGADLSSAVLGHADLRRADLRGTNLRGAYLAGTNLSNTDLREPPSRTETRSWPALRNSHQSRVAHITFELLYATTR